ncbi:MAG: type 2 isopentenyl-diphosphate Delta-isomerase [Tissierellia bacterium]|nr:type 2 isopentenyl-diphosphate Delta-isomerase [Tissierellia bacterium]
MQEYRKQRKIEHIENYLRSFTKSDPLFNDVYIEHRALNEINFDEIDTSVEFLGKKLPFPLMINAMTGGSDMSSDINEDLSNICYEFKIPMAVGSQKIVLEDDSLIDSFKVVKEMSDGEFPVIGNLNANCSIEELKKASDLIDATAMQLHLNSAQELVMPEGDRNFKGIYDNIKKLVKEFDKDIIVKEVGFGIGKKDIELLNEIGVKYIDISGHGGTNFIEIEDMRNFDMDFSDLYNWGIPTAKCLIDAKKVQGDFKIISSGGVSNANYIVKSLILGADICAMSGEILSYLLRGGYDYTINFIKELMYKTKMIMALLGVKNIEQLKKVDYKLTGKLRQLCK